MISASKVAKQNLIPFFEKWGLRPNNDTIQKVAALGYPILTAEIWKGRILIQLNQICLM